MKDKPLQEQLQEVKKAFYALCKEIDKVIHVTDLCEWLEQGLNKNKKNN